MGGRFHIGIFSKEKVVSRSSAVAALIADPLTSEGIRSGIRLLVLQPGYNGPPTLLYLINLTAAFQSVYVKSSNQLQIDSVNAFLLLTCSYT